MTLEFLCPSGHKIVCPDAHAGRGAKCPKCGIQFRIPSVEVAAAPVGTAAGDSNAGRSLPTAERIQREDPHAPQGEATSASGSGILDAPPEEMIEFLCPQGHRLSGPARLQGQPGKCPHCGSRFIVPAMNNDDDDDAEDSGMLNVEFGDDDGVDWDPGSISRVANDSQIGRFQGGPSESLLHAHPPGADDSLPADASDMAKLFLRLWQERAHGGTVEVHITGGVVLVPQWFDRQASVGTHAAFATQAADGSITLTAVSWESITRVVVRGVQGLPHGYE